MTLSKVDLNLPWSCAENGTAIVDADGAPAVYGMSIDETPAIVRAVNAHEALVAMVRDLLDSPPSDMAGGNRARARKLLASLD